MDNLFDIKDIAPPIESLPGAPIWPWIVMAILLAAVLLYIFRSKKPVTENIAPPSPPPSPLQTALHSLESLLTENLIENGATKIFFTRLNMILRIFLKDLSNLPVPAQTSSELILSGSLTAKMSEAARKRFAAFLQECDLFKFADIKAQPDIALRAHKACRNLITTIAEEQGAE